MTTGDTHGLGLYLHIPFCRQRCHFCAFYLEAARVDRITAFCAAMERELDLYGQIEEVARRSLSTVYFGGGTPTAIPAERLMGILSRVRATWAVDPAAEITVEAHPSTVTARDFQTFKDAGCNRISLGAESMDQSDYVPLGRPGTVPETKAAVEAARDAGFTNINLDVMYGLPRQSLERWRHNLRRLLELEPPHVSCYALTVEDGTTLAQHVGRGSVDAPDEALQVAMEAAAEEVLTGAGYRRYEISNYTRPGWECRHNVLYWTGRDYLGLGPSAQSYVDGVRFGDVADLIAYMEHLAAGRLPVVDRIRLSPGEQRRDALVFGLRLTDGVSHSAMEEAAGDAESRAAIDRLIAGGLLETDGYRVKLTELGRRYADTVAADLF